MVLGQQYQFIDAVEVLQDVCAVLDGVATHADALERGGVLEDVLPNLCRCFREDDGLYSLAVLEEVVGYDVVLVNLLVHAISIVTVLAVLLDAGIPEVEVSQLSVGGLAVVGIGSSQVTYHTEILAVERSDNGQ